MRFDPIGSRSLDKARSIGADHSFGEVAEWLNAPHLEIQLRLY